MRYRPDLDGLRAVAVLAVVFYHAFPSWLAGGFAGVDVFFVLSGYLISGIIVRELEAGRFSFRIFYARRARRIFPALITVLAAVGAYGFVVLLPVELAQLGADLAAGAGFVSNFLLWHDAGYFDRAALYKPLLHLWSLAVEEQFYIVWPLLLWAFRDAGAVRLAALIVLTAASFALNISEAGQDPTADFFSPATRLWELGLGALTAWAGSHGVFARLPQSVLDGLSATGLMLICAAAYFLGPAMRFPGWLALLPVCGAVAIIAAGSQAWVNRRILSRRHAVAVGLISYPLYLWHWPLLSYAIILRRGRPPTPLMALGLIAASLVLAAATYWLIERPVRRGPAKRRPMMILSGALASAGLIGLLTWIEGGFPARFPHLPRLDIAAINAAMHDGVFKPTRNMSVAVLNRITTAEIGKGPEKIVFAGDSLMFQYGPRVQQLYAEGSLHKTVYFVSGPSCAPMPGVIKDVTYAACFRMPYMALDLIEAENVGTVVLGAFWQGYGVDHAVFRSNRLFRGGTPAAIEAMYANLQDFVQQMRSKGRRVYLVMCAPASKSFDPEQMILRSPTGFQVSPEAGSNVPRAPLAKACADSDQRLGTVAARTGAVLLDPFPDVCESVSACKQLFAQGEPKFADDKHLRPVFVRDRIRFLDKVLLH